MRKADRERLRVFVYGTLKRGGRNAACLEGAHFVGEACLPGRLWVHADGIPVMQVPASSIGPGGGADARRDQDRQQAWPVPRHAPAAPPEVEGWEWVHGELYELPDPGPQLARLDALEEFDPEGGGWYDRVLLVAWTAAGPVAAWAYLADPWDDSARRLASGRYKDEAGGG